MPSVIWQSPGSDIWWQNLLHNRINLGWQTSESWRIDVGMRNRFMTGSDVMLDPAGMDSDNARADLSLNLSSGKNYLLNTALDRLYITFEQDKWKLQLGRQRINWGQTFVWNPNDLFNTYSFFDFDYPERPGCDAFRGTYYHNETSSSEIALSLNHQAKITAAMMHHWTWKNVDYQLIVGEQNESDLVLGGAWTGDFSGLNFRGEVSCFHPLRNLSDTSGIVALSVGADYIFSNSLMLQVEALYNNAGRTVSDNGLMGLYAAPMSAKTLSISEWNIFAQAACPLTPRLNASLSGMYFVDIQSIYLGFSLDYSVIENLDFSFITQLFSTAGNSDPGDMKFLMGFARMKYSF
jgi:hypothetical protein